MQLSTSYKWMHFLFLMSQAWSDLTPAPEEELEDCIYCAVYNDQMQELKSIIGQRLKGTEVVTFLVFYELLYVLVCLCVCHPL